MSDLETLLADIHTLYRHDFRGYAPASIRRRLDAARVKLRCSTLADLHRLVATDEDAFASVLPYLTVQASDMFRDAQFFAAFRQTIVPILRERAVFKIWIAGCSTGEEIDSYCVVLREEGLLARAVIYATDISTCALRAAASGTYALDRADAFARNHAQSGAKTHLSSHFDTSSGRVVFDPALRKRVVIAHHDVATSAPLPDVDVVSCRNVLIYFRRAHQERAVRVIQRSLTPRGFVGLGSRETLRFLRGGRSFREWGDRSADRWYVRGAA